MPMTVNSAAKQKAWYWKVYDFVEGILQGFFRIITKIMLGLCYYTVFALTAIILKLCGKKLIPTFKPEDATYWLEKEKLDLSLDRLKRQG